MQEILSVTAFLLQPEPLLYCIVGVAAGIVVGIIPGLGSGMLMALLLPATFAMDNVLAQVLLVGVYVGGVTGGLGSAVLIGVPGAPSSVMTAIDGHAIAKKGEAPRALSVAIVSSLFGGIFSWIVLVLMAIPLARMASQFQSFDYFVFVMLGLFLIAFAGQGSILKSLISGVMGIAIAMVGYDSISAEQRLTFGSPLLANGFDILAVLIGAFALRQMLLEAGKGPQKSEQASASIREVLKHVFRPFRYVGCLLRSSSIGTFIGLLPGIGANVGAIIAYTAAKGFSKTPEKFGEGSEEALVASESGNNSTVGGALIPMISLGIPGSAQDVLLMAALVLHQVQPGPLLATENPDVFYGIIMTFLIANVVMFFLMVVAVRFLGQILSVPRYLLVPAILMFCVIGVVSTNNRLDDAWVMFGFGILGLAMAKFRFPLAPFVIGFILGPLAEERIRVAAATSRGEWLPLILSPVPLTALAIMVMAAGWSVYARRQRLAVDARPGPAGV